VIVDNLTSTTLKNLSELANLVCEHNQASYPGPRFTTNEAERDELLDDGIYSKYLSIASTTKTADAFVEASKWELHLLRRIFLSDERAQMPLSRRRGLALSKIIRRARRCAHILVMTSNLLRSNASHVDNDTDTHDYEAIFHAVRNLGEVFKLFAANLEERTPVDSTPIFYRIINVEETLRNEVRKSLVQLMAQSSIIEQVHKGER